MGGMPVERKEYDHWITLDGNVICRDNWAVKVRGNPHGDLQVGCTRVTRSALLRLVELSNEALQSTPEWRTLQGGRS